MDMSLVPQMMYNIEVNGSTISTAIDPVILNQFWENLAIQVWPGSEIIAISGMTFRLLDDGGKHYIAHNFASVVGETTVKYVMDGSGTHPDRFFLGRASIFRQEDIITSTGDLDVWVPPGIPTHVLGTGVHAPVRRPTSSRRVRGGHLKVPRPPNAYILYRKDRHKAIKHMNPNISNNDISIILGRQWNQESDEVREHYHTLSNEIKRQVEERYPHYKYTPRKSCDIRRRRSSRGVFQIQNEETSSTSSEQEQGSSEMQLIESIPTPPMDFDTSVLESFMSLSEQSD